MKQLNIAFHKNSNGPDSKMFMMSRRSVLIDNALALDVCFYSFELLCTSFTSDYVQEGRGSKYLNPFGIIRAIGPERDFKFNCVPEVLVMDHAKKEEFLMSFHDLHLLGNNVGLQLIVTPRVRD